MIRLFQKYKIRWLLSALIPSFIFLPLSCKKNEAMSARSPFALSGLAKVRKDGRLRVIADYNSTAYFIYRGTPMGFTYEVLKDYADHLGVALEMDISSSLDTAHLKLESGMTDIVGLFLPASLERKEQVLYTDPILKVQPVLVQRKPKAWSALGYDKLQKVLVRDTRQLNGQEVYLQKSSPLIKMLTMLSFETKDSIKIVEHPEYTSYQLIQEVAAGRIDYSVDYDLVAGVSQHDFPNLDIRTTLGPEVNLVWAFARQSKDLQQDFNKWFGKYRKSRHYATLYAKYYKNPRTVRIAGSEMSSVKRGRISPYDALIKKHAKIIGWDWRLLASLIYFESKFHPEAQAWSGAMGLMQLMPETMEKYGIDSISSPDSQIEAGVKYLASIEKLFVRKVADREERQKFVLAAYNVGIGHVLDARRLAEKYGKDRQVWTGNVDSFLLRKTYPKYYTDKVVKFGYCRGEEPYNFVMDVMNMYQTYKNTIRE